jgi:uncharacterized protein (TIGR00251 family)
MFRSAERLRPPYNLAYTFHGEGLSISGFVTVILSGFLRLFYPFRGMKQTHMENVCRLKDGVLFLNIKVQPGASRSCLAGIADCRLKVKIAKAPEDGKANAELVALLSKLLGCPKREVGIVTGEKSRLKTVALPASCLEKLTELLREDELYGKP